METCKLNKVRILIEWLPRSDEERQKEVFKLIRIPWSDEPQARAKRLAKMLNKHTELVKKFRRQVEELEPDEEESTPPQFSIKDFNESMASLETLGFTIEDYRSLPLAKYEAITAVARRRLEKKPKEDG